MKRALIVGITSQDGSYMAELLLEKGYEVFGLLRRTSHQPFDRILHVLDRVRMVEGDLGDQSSLEEAVKASRPDEVYNFGAQSVVPVSWSHPVLTGEVTGLGVARLLEAVRRHKPDARFYQASSSEMFGRAFQSPQNEHTPLNPTSPYGVAKAYAHQFTATYRETHGLFACSGICYNHESPRRGLEFVTRKISYGVARIKLGMSEELPLGNLEMQRDWGFAGDYVHAMWLMLQQDQPEDFVIATGRARTVRELVETAFGCAGLDYRTFVTLDPRLVRPADPNCLVGDASKARASLSWTPRVSFEELIGLMVRSDLELLRQTPEARPVEAV